MIVSRSPTACAVVPPASGIFRLLPTVLGSGQGCPYFGQARLIQPDAAIRQPPIGQCSFPTLSVVADAAITWLALIALLGGFTRRYDRPANIQMGGNRWASALSSSAPARSAAIPARTWRKPVRMSPLSISG